MGFKLFLIKKSLVLEKGLELKKPLLTLSGEGWADFIIKCLLFIYFSFLFALLPHKIKTRAFYFSFSFLIISRVNISQPLFLCDSALCSSTVKISFKSKTPCLAHFVRFPLFGI